MYYTRIKHAIRFVVLLSVAGLTFATNSITNAAENTNGPELPAQCSSIEVPDRNQLAFHVFARGVQVYKWNGTSWDFVAPVASLFAEKNFFGEVGTHYMGPKWESKSGSKVEARRVSGTGCTPDPTAIAWLLLSKYDTSGAGIFASTTYIQRVNTTGGLAPAVAGTTINQVMEVPYTAEYYFYRAQN